MSATYTKVFLCAWGFAEAVNLSTKQCPVTTRILLKMAGSDSDGKIPSETSSQLKPSVSSNESTSEKAVSSGAPSREAVIENARRFLQEDEVRNAPTDKQIAFLESKGLQVQEIHELLGTIQSNDVSSSETEVRHTDLESR
jgi:Pex14 N-terminal domain